MKSLFLIISVNFILIPLFSGCALLQPSSEPYRDNDPFAAEFGDSDRSLATSPERHPASIADRESAELRVRDAIDRRDIVVGMSMNEVRAAWGEPADVAVAGDGRSGNQRWVYYTGLSSPWSTSPAQVVYFERGQVAGWETWNR